MSDVSNIAEGQGRLTNGQWRQFLSQARGSLFEIQAQLIVALRLELLDQAQHRRLRGAVIKVVKPLAGLIDYVRRRKAQQPRTDNCERSCADAVSATARVPKQSSP